jgi:hypothetical protein
MASTPVISAGCSRFAAVRRSGSRCAQALRTPFGPWNSVHETATPTLCGRRRGWIDPALTYFRAMHYHRPWLLDCRVRKGNGYFQPGMGTGRRLLRAGVGACCFDVWSLLTPACAGNLLGWWNESSRTGSENEIKPIDWLVPVS